VWRYFKTKWHGTFRLLTPAGISYQVRLKFITFSAPPNGKSRSIVLESIAVTSLCAHFWKILAENVIVPKKSNSDSQFEK
jgi:hypothetical protein